MFWSIIETGAAIVAACLPTMSWLTSPQGLQAIARLHRSSTSFRLTRTGGSAAEVANAPEPHQAAVTDTATSPTFPDTDVIEDYTRRPGGHDIENKPRPTIRENVSSRATASVS